MSNVILSMTPNQRETVNKLLRGGWELVRHSKYKFKPGRVLLINKEANLVRVDGAGQHHWLGMKGLDS